MTSRERSLLWLKSTKYRLINIVLFWKNYEGVLLRCLEREDVEKVLKYLHDEHAEGHYAWESTTQNFLRDGYYYPTLLWDAHAYVKKCQNFQLSTWREKKDLINLQIITTSKPSAHWGIDIIGEINPHWSKQHRYILTTTDCFSCQYEAIHLTQVNEKVVIQFLEQ